ncbi:MAG: hypothetical protein WEA77_09410 [Hyphomonas sp.]
MSAPTGTRSARALTAIEVAAALLIFIHEAPRAAAGGVAPSGGLET